MRSAPARTASSAEATAVPRSLCGCTDRMIPSRRSRLRCIHSIWSAKTFGESVSTVVGRFRVTGRSGLASQSEVTASEMPSANSGSVTLNVSGEYWKRSPVPLAASALRATCPAESSAIRRTSSWVIPNTTSRHRQAVAWHRCTIARSAPSMDSKVRSMSSGRAGVKTEIVTSSGMRSCSISVRTNENSASPAEG